METRIVSDDSTAEAESDQDFFCLELFIEAEEADKASCQDAADRVSAECWECGAEGIEERETDGGILLLIYVRRRALEPVISAGKSAGASTMGVPKCVRKQDWSEAWKFGLKAIVVSPRLIVRPSFVAVDLDDGQDELVIDPGRAFGTGGHASTLLNLEWIAALCKREETIDATTRVLDVGTGTGVLALAALKLGAGRAVAIDLDRIAAQEARKWALHNGLADRFAVFAGPLAALQCAPFDLVVANLLRSELLPIVPKLVACVASEGSIVLSGLLAEEQARIESAFAPFAIATQGARFTRDETGDRWVSLLMGRS
jgi:ribosomal protein L11 methyltransferase